MSGPDFEDTVAQPVKREAETSGSPSPPPNPSSPAPDLVGRRFGDFQILRRLGAGGMAEVFLAEQVSLKRPVALKVLRSELVDTDPLLLRRFEQEAKAAANLNHSHIVQVYAVGESEGFHYIVQEYVSGQTLKEWLRRNGPPDPLLAIRLLRQAALGLQAAEEAGIVHRDIKPENILLTKKGVVKVGDFGLAQLTQQGERLQLTQVGLTMGTPLYMSPEQVAGKGVDHRSDLYSLGVTAYQLLAGTPPFRGETALSVAIQHMNSTAEPLSQVRHDLPKALCQIVHKLIEKKPERRYQSAADLATDLRALGATIKSNSADAGKKDLAAFTVSRSVPRTDPTAQRIAGFFRWSGKRHAVMLALCVLLVGTICGAAGWVTRPADPLSTPPGKERVAKATSVWRQFQAALLANSPENWQAVIDYYPEDRVFTPVAKTRLGVLRLQEGKLEEAGKLFQDLATTSSENQHKANGYAGLAILAALRGETETYRDIVRQNILTLGVRSLDRDLSNYLEEVYARNRSSFSNDKAQAADFEELLRKASEANRQNPPATL